MPIVKRKSSTSSIHSGTKSSSMDQRVRDSVMGGKKEPQVIRDLRQNKKRGKLK